jgi:hypothetical protein
MTCEIDPTDTVWLPSSLKVITPSLPTAVSCRITRCGGADLSAITAADDCKQPTALHPSSITLSQNKNLQTLYMSHCKFRACARLSVFVRVISFTCLGEEGRKEVNTAPQKQIKY